MELKSAGPNYAQNGRLGVKVISRFGTDHENKHLIFTNQWMKF